MCRHEAAKRQATAERTATTSAAPLHGRDGTASADAWDGAGAARRVLAHDLLLKEVLGFAAGHGGGGSLDLDSARVVGRQWRAAADR